MSSVASARGSAILYGDRVQFGRRVLRLAIHLLLILLAVVQAFPLAWMLLTSVKNSREVFGTFLPKHLDFSNFAKVWFNLNLPLHLLNSVIVTGLTVAIVVVVSTLAGYAFSRFTFRGREWIFYLFIGSMMIPGQAILIPMFQFLKSLGLLNSLVGLSLSYLGSSVAFGIFMMRAFFEGLPHELAEQGRIDGANEFQVFWHVFLPLTRPGIATVVIIQSLSTWNEFMFSNTYITSPDLKTIQPALFQAVGRYSTDYAALSAGLVLALIPIVAVYLIMQRQFIEGLTAGAVKG